MPLNALGAGVAATASRGGATSVRTRRYALPAASESASASLTRNAAGRARPATTASRGAPQTTRRPALRASFSRPREARTLRTVRHVRVASFAWRHRPTLSRVLEDDLATRQACPTLLARANVRGATFARRAASAPRRRRAPRAATATRPPSYRKPTAAPVPWAIRAPRLRTSRLHAGLGQHSPTLAKEHASTVSPAPS